MIRHFLDLDALPATALRSILDYAKRMKALRKGWPKGALDDGAPLAGHMLAMIFEKSSTRTRVSFHVGMRQLGGEALILTNNDTQLGRGETVADTAQVLSRYVDCIMLRAGAHANLLELAAHASVPVINGLTDDSHPCQVMADIQTVEERLGNIAGKTVAWVGDGNNMATSWVHAAGRFGFELRLACPKSLAPSAKALAWAKKEGARVRVLEDPGEAVTDADVVTTDTWVSMGQTGADERRALLAPYQVNAALMRKAKRQAIFLHCLPAHRDEEVTAEVIDGERSVVWDEAENRLHAQKAILLWCLGKLPE